MEVYLLFYLFNFEYIRSLTLTTSALPFHRSDNLYFAQISDICYGSNVHMANSCNIGLSILKLINRLDIAILPHFSCICVHLIMKYDDNIHISCSESNSISHHDDTFRIHPKITQIYTQWKMSSFFLWLFSYNLHFKQEYSPNLVPHYSLRQFYEAICISPHCRHFTF